MSANAPPPTSTLPPLPPLLQDLVDGPKGLNQQNLDGGANLLISVPAPIGNKHAKLFGGFEDGHALIGMHLTEG